MTAFAVAFKQEVARMVRKEVKDEIMALRRTNASQRSDIAGLKRDLKALSGQVNALHKAQKRTISTQNSVPLEAQAASKAKAGGLQFTFKPEVLAAKRESLGITQKDMATLLDASSLSVWKWETGKVTPRTAQMDRIRTVLKLGKREALAKLAE